APPLRECGKRDGDDQCRAVEQGLDEEGAAKQLDAGDADREYENAEYAAPDIDAPRLDRRRAEEGADQRRQQEVQADVRLADAQLRAEHAAGEAGNDARGDENADNISAHRNAVERGGFFISADGVNEAAERQPLADDPQNDCEPQHIEGRYGEVEHRRRVDGDEAARQVADNLAPAGVPKRERVQNRASPQRRDKGVDLRHLDQHAVEEADEPGASNHQEDRDRPRDAVFDLKADGENVPHHDAEADGQIDAT